MQYIFYFGRFYRRKSLFFVCGFQNRGKGPVRRLRGALLKQRPPCRKNNKSSRAVPTMKMQEGKNLQRNIANVIHADNTEACTENMTEPCLEPVLSQTDLDVWIKSGVGRKCGKVRSVACNCRKTASGCEQQRTNRCNETLRT